VNGSLASNQDIRWNAKEPNGGTTENCGNMLRSVSEYKMNDLRCHWKRSAICEVPPQIF